MVFVKKHSTTKLFFMLIALFLILITQNCMLNKKQRNYIYMPWEPIPRTIIWSGVRDLATNFIVSELDTLIIQSGTRIILSSVFTNNIYVNGTLMINGTASSPVIFTNITSTICNITISGENKNNQVRYCDFNINNVIMNYYTVFENNKVKYIKTAFFCDSVIRYNYIGLLNCIHYSAPDVERNIFDRGKFFPPEIQDGIVFNIVFNIRIDDWSFPDITYNNIMGNSTFAGVSSSNIVIAYTDEDILLNNNYWQTNDISHITNELIFKNLGRTITCQPISLIPNSAGPGF